MQYFIYIFLFVTTLIACQSNTEMPKEKGTIVSLDVIPSDNLETKVDREEEEEEEEEEIEDEMPSRVFEWTGKINGSIAIRGHYRIANGFMDSGMDVLVGELIYDKVGKPIQLFGQLENGGKYVRLFEMDKKGNVTGILSGKWKNGSITEGSWFSPTKRNSLSLEIKAVPQNESNYNESKTNDIVGKYHYEYGKDGHVGTLNVQSVKDNEVTFELFCLTQAPARNIASVEEAIEPMTNYTINMELSESCQFKIRFFDGFAVINYTNNKVDCGFGHNADVAGIFKKIEE